MTEKLPEKCAFAPETPAKSPSERPQFESTGDSADSTKNQNPKKRGHTYFDGGNEKPEKPRKRLRMKKHRPKVVKEVKLKRTQVVPLTPKNQTPERVIPKTVPRTKREVPRKKEEEYTRKNNLNTSNLKTGNRVDGNISCKRNLDFNTENCISNISNGVEGLSPQVAQMLDRIQSSSSLDVPLQASSSSDISADLGLKVVTVPEKVYFLQYRRNFRPNECQKNSRKLGPNFPKMFKRSRMRRQRRTAFREFSILMIAKECLKTNNIKVRKNARTRTPMRLAKIMTRIKVGNKEKTATRKNSLSSLKELARAILPTEKQRTLAIHDPASFDCVLNLIPLVKVKKRRSSRRIWLNLKSTEDPKKSKATTGQHNVLIPETSLLEDLNVFDIKDSKSEDMAVTNALNTCQAIVHEVEVASPCRNIKEYPAVLVPRNVVGHRKYVEKRPSKIKPCLKLIPRTLPPNLEKDYALTSRDDKACVEALVNFVIQKLQGLRIDDGCNELVVLDRKGLGSIIPFKRNKNKPNDGYNELVVWDTKGLGAIVPSRRKKNYKPNVKIALDEECERVWILVMRKEVGTEDVDNDPYLKKERDTFSGRMHSFITQMSKVLGDHKFSEWKGSVLDSVMGVFLTQNVTDYLSSNAFLRLAAKYPQKSDAFMSLAAKYPQESDATNVELIGCEVTQSGQSAKAYTEKLCDFPTEQNICNQNYKWQESATMEISPSFCVTDEESVTAETSPSSCCNTQVGRELTTSCFNTQVEGEPVTKKRNSPSSNTQVQGESAMMERNPSSFFNSKVEVEPNNRDSTSSPTNSALGRKNGKPKDKPENIIDWDKLRRRYELDHTIDTMDSVNWEAVRQAPLEEVAATIKGRGMHNTLAKNMKDFLDLTFELHGSFNLEWLRNAPPDDVKNYLLRVHGLGLKSVECVRLLALHNHAFPVDTNVCRMLVRLGWVPLQTLPGDLHIHLLNAYPDLAEVQKYVWPRLCHHDKLTLYQFHYLLITAGKVFCTKKNPNCNACPMRGECKHFANACASSRLRLQGPKGGNTTMETPVEHNQNQNTPQLLSEGDLSKTKNESRNCAPIIEIPASPEREPPETQIQDIEDFGIESASESEDVILTMKIDQKFKQNVLSLLGGEVNMSKELVAMTSGAASSSLPRVLKQVEPLRTIHQVIELPDSHFLLAGFPKREPEDPCPYLFALSSDNATSFPQQSMKSCNCQNSTSCDNGADCSWQIDEYQYNNKIVHGTILIPCRTANKGAFPLNGTYFQVKEVFVDAATRRQPIAVPQQSIIRLPRRLMYCGTSVTSIMKGLSMDEVGYIFRDGFICVREFNRSTRRPSSLTKQFHLTKSKSKRYREDDE